VERIEFYDFQTKIGEAQQSPCRLELQNPQHWAYLFWAKAVSAAGVSANSPRSRPA
jgi:hypothetical protein